MGMGVRSRGGNISLKNERGNVSHTVSPRSHRLRGATGNEAKIYSQIEISLQAMNDRVGYLHNCLGFVNTKPVRDENSSFIERFIEVCGTSEPAKIQRLLNISYQAARNYLQGRLPDSYVLRTIAEQTPYSLNWLLTGKGEKFASSTDAEDTPLSSRQIRDLIRKECRDVVDEVLRTRDLPGQKVVVLQSDSLKSEKVKETLTVSEEES